MSVLSSTEKKPLKYVATINDEALGEDTDPGLEIKYVDIGNVDSMGRIQDIETYRFEDAPSRARRIIRKGDVIISTVRTYLQAIASIETSTDNLVVSTGFAVIRPRPGILNTKYCKYALCETGFLHEVVSCSVGVSYPAITSVELGNIPIYVPPLPEQRAIADYLDHETARIDTLIAAIEDVLVLLAEKRQALISHAVTQGLNPNVPMHDTGMEWVSEIPAHWECDIARWLFREVDERSSSTEDELLTVSHLTGVTPRSEKNVSMFMAESTEGYKICQLGDLISNTLWAWMGAMGIAFHDGVVSPSYHVYRPCKKFDALYLDYLVRIPAFAKEVTRYSKGVWSSRLRLYPEEFFQIHLPVPPLAEQKEIAYYLTQETKKLDTLVQRVQEAIELLRERRAALITAAVTGRINVYDERAEQCYSTNLPLPNSAVLTR